MEKFATALRFFGYVFVAWLSFSYGETLLEGMMLFIFIAGGIHIGHVMKDL